VIQSKATAAISGTIGMAAAVVTAESPPPWWIAPGFLLVGLLIVQFFEILACLVRSVRTGSEYSWRRESIEKIFTWMLWVCTLILDGILHFLPYMFPSVNFPFLSQPSFLPFSITFTFIALVSEMKSFAMSVKAIQGANAIAADTALLMLGSIHSVHQQRLKTMPEANQPLPSRWSDYLTAEQLVELAEYARGKIPPPQWLVDVSPDHVPTPEEIRRESQQRKAQGHG
jgi:hypothetical protein